jgi:tetratricopeptide (TPR) repeat protein
MRIFSAPARDASGVASPSRQESWVGKLQPSRRLVVAGLGFLLIMVGVGLGLRMADPWHWWDRKTSEHSVHRYLDQANLAIQDGDFALAKTHLQAILEICPLNARVQFLMARTCRRDDDPAALGYLDLAESFGWPRDQILLEHRLRQAQSGDTWSVEEALLEELNRLTPEEQVILEGLVKGYLNSARFADAVAIATTWIKRYPDDWLSYLDRGRGYQGLGQWEKAISDYQKVLKTHPESISATLWCAEAFWALNDYQNALDTYQAYRKMAPDDWESLFAIAECQFSLRQPEARATLENLLNKHPQHRRGLLLAAKIDMAENAPAKALPNLRKAMELGSPDPEVLQALIVVLQELKRFEEADQVEKQHRPILEKTKQFNQLKGKIQAEPRDPSLRYQAGILALELGHEKDARDWFQTVLYIDPGHRATHLTLADYWSKHGEPERAAYHRRRAALNP